jgi:hypothetical protein
MTALGVQMLSTRNQLALWRLSAHGGAVDYRKTVPIFYMT